MISEMWFPIPGYVGLYSVSDLGNVMSMNYANTGMLRLLTPNKTSHGYWRVSMFLNKKQVNKYVHSLVMLAFAGPRKIGMHINHKNADKRDNRLCNLEYCTPKQNKEHAKALGLCANGANNGGAKLSELDVLEIREKLNSGKSHRGIKISLAKEYGVSRFTVYRIATGSHWQNSYGTVQ